MNFFEQQARQDQRMAREMRKKFVDEALHTFDSASMEESYKMMIVLSERLRVFESDAVNEDAKSNLEEAKRMQIDVATNVYAAMQEEPKEPHELGCKCDSCRAAASDVAHDMFVDAQLLKGNHGK